MRNPKKLVIGKKYLLKTLTTEGFDRPVKEWIKVKFNGVHLIDADGCHWDEWLSPNYDDIFIDE